MTYKVIVKKKDGEKVTFIEHTKTEALKWTLYITKISDKPTVEDRREDKTIYISI